ncbi:hypothetical protein NE237_026738 [Protea cynaroides]|uniref:Reverse transcriptase domain-containing protein n=1 Tax=Protea cynaroides TaxID=273540 RepID=A0A9Q0JRW6_9MAGN|nr:hypothetical protein NE237_026738 [Protea cynaroides]
MCKVDLRKAYDSIRWETVLLVLEAMNFPRKMIDWIRVCISSAKFSISINRVPHGYFPSSRGLRQGSIEKTIPLCVSYAGSGGDGILKAKVDEGLLSLHHRCTNPMITHLCFADEKLVLFHGDVVSAAAVKDVLHHFHYVTGRQANVSKSKAAFRQW